MQAGVTSVSWIGREAKSVISGSNSETLYNIQAESHQGRYYQQPLVFIGTCTHMYTHAHEHIFIKTCSHTIHTHHINIYTPINTCIQTHRHTSNAYTHIHHTHTYMHTTRISSMPCTYMHAYDYR